MAKNNKLEYEYHSMCEDPDTQADKLEGERDERTRRANATSERDERTR
jgi:hypothetical protein